jgi:hypothetical protein
MSKAGISWHDWNANELVHDGLVIAGVEALNDEDTFIHWCRDARAQGILNRIVFDEAHLAITSEFRPVMGNIHHLVEVGVPVIALSATVPPIHEPRLRAAFGHPEWVVLREPTQRPNISYNLAWYRNSVQALQALKLHVNHFLGLLHHNEAILIHCRTVSDAQKVQRELKIPAYIASDTDANKHNVLADWKGCNTPVIASTSALGAGVHHPGCRAVFHFGVPWGMIEYVQESGRAGRDGNPAVSILFHWGVDFDSQDPDISGLMQLQEMLDHPTCHRAYVSSYIDGAHAQVTCSMGLEPCGPCQLALERANERQGTNLNGPDYWETQVKNASPNVLIMEAFAASLQIGVDSQSNQSMQLSPQSDPVTPPRKPYSSSISSTSMSLGGSPMHMSPIAMGKQRSPYQQQPSYAQVLSPNREAQHPERSGAGPSRVSLDQERAATRNRQNIEEARLQRGKPLSFTVARVLLARKKVANCCIHCLVVKGLLCDDHLLSQCPERDTAKLTWDLSEYKFKGAEAFFDTLKTYCRDGKMDGGYRVCWYCWWPRVEDHPQGSCKDTDKDQIPQLCWLLLFINQLAVRAGGYFGLDESVCQDAGKFMHWASQMHHFEKYKNKESGVLNGQCLLLWVMEVVHKLKF